MNIFRGYFKKRQKQVLHKSAFLKFSTSITREKNIPFDCTNSERHLWALVGSCRCLSWPSRSVRSGFMPHRLCRKICAFRPFRTFCRNCPGNYSDISMYNVYLKNIYCCGWSNITNLQAHVFKKQNFSHLLTRYRTKEIYLYIKLSLRYRRTRLDWAESGMVG